MKYKTTQNTTQKKTQIKLYYSGILNKYTLNITTHTHSTLNKYIHIKNYRGTLDIKRIRRIHIQNTLPNATNTPDKRLVSRRFGLYCL